MKRIFLLLLTLALVLPTMAYAQNEKERVAVFDPSGTATIDEGTRIAIREIISSTIVNSGKYNIVERSMLEKVMQEQTFSNSGAVDDSQATEIGKLAGANKVIVSVITISGRRTIFSIKMINVKTANIEKQKIKTITSNELLDVIEPITLELIDAKLVIATSPKAITYTLTDPQDIQKQPEQSQETLTPKEKPIYSKGYKGFAEIGVGLGAGTEGFAFSGALYTTHGYQCSPYFFIGGGLGTELVFDYADEIGALSLFAETRLNLRNPNSHKKTSHLGLRVGYEILNSGVMFNLFWGKRWPISKSLALNFNLGYELLSRPYSDDYYSGSYYDSNYYGGSYYGYDSNYYSGSYSRSDYYGESYDYSESSMAFDHLLSIRFGIEF